MFKINHQTTTGSRHADDEMHKIMYRAGSLLGFRNHMRSTPGTSSWSPRLFIKHRGWSLAMSDDGSTAAGATGMRDSETKLYGAAGEPLRSTSGSAASDQLADFVKQQPLTAALVALVIGYLLGKVT
jgi:hypothetical protein